MTYGGCSSSTTHNGVVFTGASSVAVTRRPYHGRVVRVIQPHGCPKNGTMGHVYVEVAETREFIGLVLINSLTNESGGRDQPRRLTRARACYRLASPRRPSAPVTTSCGTTTANWPTGWCGWKNWPPGKSALGEIDMKMRGRDGRIVVATVVLEGTANRGEDGEWIRITRDGFHVGLVKTVEELALIVDVAELVEDD